MRRERARLGRAVGVVLDVEGEGDRAGHRVRSVHVDVEELVRVDPEVAARCALLVERLEHHDERRRAEAGRDRDAADLHVRVPTAVHAHGRAVRAARGGDVPARVRPAASRPGGGAPCSSTAAGMPPRAAVACADGERVGPDVQHVRGVGVGRDASAGSRRVHDCTQSRTGTQSRSAVSVGELVAREERGVDRDVAHAATAARPGRSDAPASNPGSSSRTSRRRSPTTPRSWCRPGRARRSRRHAGRCGRPSRGTDPCGTRRVGRDVRREDERRRAAGVRKRGGQHAVVRDAAAVVVVDVLDDGAAARVRAVEPVEERRVAEAPRVEVRREQLRTSPRTRSSAPLIAPRRVPVSARGAWARDDPSRRATRARRPRARAASRRPARGSA